MTHVLGSYSVGLDFDQSVGSLQSAYEEANRINPFDPEVHDALAQLGIRLQDQELHQRELARKHGSKAPSDQVPKSQVRTR